MGELESGREAFAARAWRKAYEALSGAERAGSLSAEDLELLSMSAYMLGRDEDYLRCLERAHHAYLTAGDPLRAVRCAFWVGLALMVRGEMSHAAGWFSRAQRLLEREQRESVEQGYLLIPDLLQHVASGDSEAAYATAAKAAEIGDRFGDSDLIALVVQEQGHALVRQGRAEEGLRLVDEAMVAVTAGELSPIVTGLVYCNTIAFCQSVYELRRAREWTAALTRWCEQEPEMVAYTGQCLVHRAEIMQMQGAWGTALEEARRAGERFAQGVNQSAAPYREGAAFYRQGEVHRLRGELAAAEEAYGEASRFGAEPQPGLALVRLAQGEHDAAVAAIRRVLAETPEPLERPRLLAAWVEITLAAGDVDRARSACGELDEIASRHQGGMLGALAAHARGSVELAAGDPQAALGALRQAQRMWQELEAPYETARGRELVGLACRALGDDDTARLELEAARGVFAELGAGADLARVEALAEGDAAGEAHGLTPRELEVLRLVAAGKSNREVASALVVSEHTVARHMQNIFAKLGVSSRTAASAFAFEHELV